MSRGDGVLRTRMLVLGAVVVLLMTMLLGRLGQLQLAPEAVAGPGSAAVANTRTIITPAVRGRILDRTGLVLADNTALATVTIERAALVEAEDGGQDLITRLAAALDLPAPDVWARTTSCGTPGAARPPLCWDGSPYVPIPLAVGIDPQRALSVAERPDRFPGVAVVAEPVRVYPSPLGVNAAHVLGYLGRVTSDEVDRSTTLTERDLIGRTGIEQRYDEVLRGTPGRTVVAVDARGLVRHVVTEVDPVPGKDVVLNIDARVQVAAERALADQIAAARKRGAPATSGAAVVLDPRTGAVVAAASNPAYDPNVWTGGISSKDYAALTDPGNGVPLLNRVVTATYPPASTFKVISTQAAVSAGNSLTARYACPATLTIGNRTFRNHESRAHGRITLHEAIEVSCNTVFYGIANRAWQAAGGVSAAATTPDPFSRAATAFGLGTVTAIDLPGEVPGRVPSREAKKATWETNRATWCERAETGYPEEKDAERAAYLTTLATENCATGYLYNAGDAANLSVGQGEIAVTPLQMAMVYAAVAGDGKQFTPRVAAAVVDEATGQRTAVRSRLLRTVTMDPKVAAYERSALTAAVLTGTARWPFTGFPLDAWPVAGKTGTAEVLGKANTSWFVSWAPVASPKYVVAVVVAEGGYGADTAAPAARAIHEVLRTLPN